MSVVSGITLQVSCAEELNWGSETEVYIIEKITNWLSEVGFGPLESVEERYSGNKHPQILVYGAGYNGFLEDEFAQFVLSLPWRNPENVVLLINPEYGPTKVFRPVF